MSSITHPRGRVCVCVWTAGRRCFRLALKCLTSDEKQMFAEMFAAKLL